jgi:hypothetical protein
METMNMSLNKIFCFFVEEKWIDYNPFIRNKMNLYEEQLDLQWQSTVVSQ